MSNSPPQPEIITQLLDAVYSSFALLAGMELELFTQLEDGSLSAEQIANLIGVNAIKLKPLLYALVAAGLLNVNDDLFSNTPEAEHFLVRGKPAYLGGTHELISSNWSKLLKTAATIRAGGPLTTFDTSSMTQDEIREYFCGLNPGAVGDARRLMEHYDFSSYGTLLDVAGGSGSLAITIAQANPGLKATVIDLPSVTPFTKQFVEESNMTDQIDIVAADAIRGPLEGSFDVIVARHFVHVLCINDVRALLKNLADVIKPGGVIHLIGWLLDNSRLSPKEAVNHNLLLLTGYENGQAYTEQEHHDWLTEEGFGAFERVLLSEGRSILTARKPI